jgi:acyl-CoA thioester hydrolase
MGYVHHSNYLKYFEMARIEWLTSMGFSYKKLEDRGTIMPVVTLNLKFKSPCFFDDLISVHLSINELPKASIFFKYIITNELKKEVATGSTRIAFLDKKNNKIIRCPKNLMSAIQKLM